MEKGFAGNIAKTFIQSKLTILLMIAFLLIGGYATMLIPREEEPQIKVPMADVFLGYPGADPKEVETKVVEPMEKIISNIKGVEYVYSTSMNGQAMLIVQFYVGEDVERSLVKLYDELMKNMDKMPQGVSMPLIKSRAIDDVPVLGLTLWSKNYSDYDLKQIGEVVKNEIKKIPDVSTINILGGRSREVKVVLDKDKMAENHVDFLSISKQIQASNAQMLSGDLLKEDSVFAVKTGNFLSSDDDVKNLVVGVNANQPVYLKQIATVEDGAETPNQYVFFGYGSADTSKLAASKSNYPAITLAIAKKSGADAMNLSEQIISKVEQLKKNVIPSDVQVTVTRNYGETASDKVSELLFHLIYCDCCSYVICNACNGLARWFGGVLIRAGNICTYLIRLLFPRLYIEQNYIVCIGVYYRYCGG